MTLPSLKSVFAADGYLSDAFEGYQPRDGQIKMAGLVQDAINDQHTLVIEAGTGVGKTFGYLAPVLLSGKRALISTGTKHLQDQLFHRDLPRLRQILGVKTDIALLKGRANYLCPYRLEQAQKTARFSDRRWRQALATIERWALTSKDGDKSTCAAVGDDHGIWPLVTSTNDNCLGRECPLYEQCPVVKARERAAKADVVVINHHLFCADLALKQTGFAELLPQTDVVVLDEAHQLPEIASAFFGESITARQLRDLIQDLGTEAKAVPALPSLPEAGSELDAAIKKAREALGETTGTRVSWEELADNTTIFSGFEQLREALEVLTEELKQAAPRSKGLGHLHSRSEQLLTDLTAFLQQSETAAESVRWLEVHAKSFALHTTPVNAAGEFKNQIESAPRAWVMTSATLAAGEDFSHFTRRMFIPDARCYQVPSPFDYQKQALLYLPEDIPEPIGPEGAREHTLAALRRVFPLLKASQGRAFLLFTSYRALELAASILEEHLTELPLFVQGAQSKSALLDAFRESGNGVLLGTQSFWEGVDVRGEALSLVMIDKIPFAAPGDPVRQAREARLKEKGLSPFVYMALPEAIITLKQGVGRLIRDVEDQGVLVLCDPRLTRKSYGERILDSLPPMSRTRQFAQARDKIIKDVAPVVHPESTN